jgi:hypothetical protein
MINVDVQAMIEWHKHEIGIAEKSIAYYQQHPEKGKRGLLKNYIEDLAYQKIRLEYWQSLLQSNT